jgi:hypothetical protein
MQTVHLVSTGQSQAEIPDWSDNGRRNKKPIE